MMEGVVRWFRALLPREERFFDLFNAHAVILVRAATSLQAMLEGGEAVAERSQEVMALEHDADAITRDVLIAVRRTFITPFDRRDIIDLISSMDDAMDQMEQTAKTILLYDIRTFEPAMLQLAACILHCAQLVKEALPLLTRISANAGELNTRCERIVHLEAEADGIHEDGLKKLYQACRERDDGLIFVTRAEVLDHLEKVVDRFSDVSDEIQGVVIDQV
jgi:predicted phosphate transport protein (TIGR00153 family)